MKKLIIVLALSVLTASLLHSQQQYRRPVRSTKNLIVMIPDGTSIGVMSAARWHQIYNKGMEHDRLAIDPYICGTVKTFNSNSPIGDSAPTTSCYMTGFLQQSGNVAIYPVADKANDLFPVDPTMAYQPLTTLLEAAKYEQEKSVGLVVTVEFPHATPADCSAHYYDRDAYRYIAPQIVYQNLDVMFGGGNAWLTDDLKAYMKSNGTELIQNDLSKFRQYDGKDKLWALFGDNEMPFDIDRDTTQVPSLAEMTVKALDRLSANDNGFFLMVEGSKIDWAAHSNDAVGVITEYLAFDKAVNEALGFAKKDGQTTVVILSDHGTGGFSTNNYELEDYSRASLSKLFGNVSKYKRTAAGIEAVLEKASPEQFKSLFKKYTDIDLTDRELSLLVETRELKKKNYKVVGVSVNMESVICKIMNSRTYFNFTTNGHTADEVLLAAYHPQGDIPLGMNTNVEINQYMFDALGLKTSLPEITKQLFAKHADVFAGLNYTIDKSVDCPILIVKKGKNTLVVPAFKSVAYLNGSPINLESVTVYIDKNDTFYLPASLAKVL